MDLTTANIRLLNRGFSKEFQLAFTNKDPWWPKVATLIPSTSSEEIYGWLLKIPRMREWLGDRVLHNVATAEHSIKNKDFELTIEVEKNHIEDDKLGIYGPIAQMIGEQAKVYPDDLIASLMINGENTLCYDGQNFFDTDHATGAFGIQSNLFTAKPLTEDNFAFVRAKMTAYMGEDGRPMKVMPNLLVVPPSLEITARKIVNATLTTNGGTNVLAGMAEILVIADLEVAPGDWYLLDTRMPIKPFIFQQRQAPRFAQLTEVTDANVFFHKKFVWGVDARGNAGYGPWFLAAKAKAA